MELYRKYPVLCTLWAFMEVLLFAGVIYGWGSLVFVFKEEGFYLDYCTGSDVVAESELIQPDKVIVSSHDALYSVSNSHFDNGTELSQSNRGNGTEGGHVNEGCPAQESKLNLWFSMSVSFMYLSFAGIGYLIRHLGTRITRIIFYFIYLIGTLCLAFASPDIPWLILPGLCCIGTGGMTMLATNLQVSYLHPRMQSTIIAIFTGMFDFSSINKQLIRIAYMSGIPRRTSYIFITAVFAFIISISTLLFLPKMNITEESMGSLEKRRKCSKQELKGKNIEEDVATETKEGLLKNDEQDKNMILIGGIKDDMKCMESLPHEAVRMSTPSLCSTVFSVTCLLHLYWVFVHALRFVTFIGQLNIWLENIFHDEIKVGEMLSIFSYMTMGAILTALLCGFVYDYQRKRYTDAGAIKRVYIPVVLPMSLVIFYSIATTILCYINHYIAPYFAFALFTFFRSALYTVAVAFVGEAFPIEYFGVLFGFIQFVSGIAGLAQYPLFEWYKAYEGSVMHVSILLAALQVSTIIHPVLLYIKGHRDRSDQRSQALTQKYTANIPSTA